MGLHVTKTITKSWSALASLVLAAALAVVFVVPASAADKPGKTARVVPKKAKAAKAVPRKPVRRIKVAPPRPSFGQMYGLHGTDDALDLKSSVALVVDQDTNEVLFSKNPQAVLPIASITKLMTALVVADAALPLEEKLTVSADDVAATSGNRSRLKAGTELTRGELMHLSLMASENRAAHVLGRTYPGGMERFVGAMNAKAQMLGMQNTRYVEPTGLSANNQSSAQDLSRLVAAASQVSLLRELSTSLDAAVAVGRKMVQFRNTNGLVRNPEWDIGLQKTGYISAAGRCVVMQTQLAGRKLIMVLLDSAGKYSRIGDAERIRNWLSSEPPRVVAPPVSAAPVVPAALAAAVPAATSPLAPRVAPIVLPAAATTEAQATVQPR